METRSAISSLSANTAAEKAVRLPGFDEVMAELMLQMAIRDINRKADARRQRRFRVERGSPAQS